MYDTEVSGGGGRLKQQDREQSLRALMTVNLLKRLESSVAAFRLTLQKLQQIHLNTLARIESYQRTGQGDTFSDLSSVFEDTEPDEDMDFLDPEDLPSEMQTGGKVKIQLSDMNLPGWEHVLRADLQVIEALLAEMEKVSPADDAKLQHLKHHILDKIAAPINPGNRKVLLFTAFADTADYLYEHLSPALRQQGLHSARVVGSDRPKSTLGRKTDFQELLMLFSPRSKEKALLMPDVQDEIDLKVRTFRTAITSSTTTSTGTQFALFSVLAASTVSAPQTPPSSLSTTGQTSRLTSTSGSKSASKAAWLLPM
jgi:hypothetical protein